MKSILKVRILGIDYYTMKKVSINKKIECIGLNFIQKIIPSIKINNGNIELPETIISPKQQADEWLSNQNDLLNSFIYDTSKELKCIMNWEILSIENINSENDKTIVFAPKIKKEKLDEVEQIGLVLKRVIGDKINISDEFKNDFLHTYQEIKDSLSGISIDRKILIVLRAMRVGLKAQSNVYDWILGNDNKGNEEQILIG